VFDIPYFFKLLEIRKMISANSTAQIIAISNYYIDELSTNSESLLMLLDRKLPNLGKSEKSFFGHVDKKKLIFDAAFRTKTNVEFQLLIQRDYVLFSRYLAIKFFGDEKKMYCSLSAFSARETFPDFERYTNFVRGEDLILDLDIGGQSLIRWILKCSSNLSLSELERQIVCYEIKQLTDYFHLQIPEKKLLDILKLSSSDITHQSYGNLLETVCDFGFSIWKSYFRTKPNFFYQCGETECSI